MSLKFNCSKCGCEELEIVQTDVVLSSKVVDIDEKGYFEFEQIDCEGGNIDRYQCFKCGLVLKDDQGKVLTTEEQIVEWVRENCDQDAGK